jgi:hypothetical protein
MPEQGVRWLEILEQIEEYHRESHELDASFRTIFVEHEYARWLATPGERLGRPHLRLIQGGKSE